VIKKRAGKVGFVGTETEDDEDDETLRDFTLLLLDITIRKSVEDYFAAKEVELRMS
jgi:hypothetical protein